MNGLESNKTRVKPKLGNPKSFRQNPAAGVRRCDLCDEPMADEQKTEFNIIDGIPARRHAKCIEEHK